MRKILRFSLATSEKMTEDFSVKLMRKAQKNTLSLNI